MHLVLKTGPLCPIFCTRLQEPCSFSKVPDAPKFKGWWQATFTITMYADYSNQIFKTTISTSKKTQCVTIL